MAASISRPDPSSPASVAEAGFATSRRGYSQDEVRAFLVAVAAEMSRLRERERRLDAELVEARDVVPATVELDDETVTKLLGEETLRVLQTARESASQIKIRAEESAARIVREANEDANRLRQETEVEAARKRHDASADAEAEVSLAKQQGREMVNEARSYRERVLADLERRTTLARHQIEELVQGRDRLLQVFERARLVAVDVTSELASIDGPDELVNLAPTTGPVPIMVPRIRPDVRPVFDGADEGAEHDDDLAGDPETTDVAPDAAARPDDTPDDTPDVETDRSVAADDLADDGSDASATDGTHEATTAEVSTADATHDDVDDPTGDDGHVVTAPSPQRDANVVSLFRGRNVTEPSMVDAGDVGASTADEIAIAPLAADDADDADDRVVGPDDDTTVMEQPDVDGGADSPADESTTAEHSAVGDGVGDDTGASTRPDVGGIFARLREAPEILEADDGTADAAADGTDADTGDLEAGTTDVDPDAATEADPPAASAPTSFSRRDEAVVPLIVAGARKLKRVLADEQNGVLDSLRSAKPVTGIDDILPGVDEHQARYVGALDDELLGAAAAGAGELGRSDTKTLRRTLAKSGALDAAHALLRSDLVHPLRSRLERAINDGAGDNEDITKRVRSVYREWKTQHIDDQLDDLFRFSHGGGLAAMVEPGTLMIWRVDPSRPACPDCEDNSLSGPVAAGDTYPTGHTSAPAHPGCRCLTTPHDQ
ncbi:MAG: DivIVA domain-containing protein [Ilumatobacteraceae bacterium]